MCIDGELRFFLAQEVESRLAEGLPVAAWRRQVKAETWRGEIDFYDVSGEVPGCRLTNRGSGDAGVGVCRNGLGASHPGACQQDQHDWERPDSEGGSCAGTQ